MNANNGWPGKPGIPLNPEQDGWHWLENTVDGVGTGHIEAVYYAAWSVPTWYRAGNRSPMKKPENWIYLGPCLTPDEATALQKRHEEAERTALQAAECHARETRRADALQARVAELEEALSALQRDASQEIATDEMVRRLQHLGDWQAADRIDALRKRVAELEEALRFYADPFKYTDIHGDDVRVPHFYSETDFGETARAALEGGKDG